MPTLGGVDGVVGVVCSSAVLVGVLVAMDVAVLMTVVVCFRHTSLLLVANTYALGLLQNT